MKKRIFLYFIVITVIGIIVAGFFISELAQRIYRSEVEERLKSSAALIINHIYDDKLNGEQADYNSYAQKYASILKQSGRTGALPDIYTPRITFIDFNGVVAGESQTDYKEMENHLDRKEVKEAVEGKTGEDVRHSKTINTDLLYIAVPSQQLGMILRISVPLYQLHSIDRVIWLYTAIGIFAGLIITALLALRFSSMLIQPIQELTGLSKEISNGNYSKRLKVKSTDELGQLSQSFNEMANQLENNIADLKDKNIKVDAIINSITNGIIAVDGSFKVILINAIAMDMFGVESADTVLGTNMIELVRNNQINSMLEDSVTNNRANVNEIFLAPPEDKILRIYTNPIKPGDSAKNTGGIVLIHDITNIRELEQIRTEFVSNVTHELKTPLTSIRGFIETLRNGAISDIEVADKFLEIIDIEAERLYMLINDILQLSEIENRQGDINISTHNLKEIADEIILILQSIAQKRGITLHQDISSSITIRANRDRIKQMLINLVDNAIKYNVDNGSVYVSAAKEEGRLVIKVRDTGIGMAHEHIPRIFERFYRVDKGRSRNLGGTGLGLSIVKHIVNLYSGNIKVTSHPMQGTEFEVQLPV